LEADFDCLIPPEDVGAVLFELVQGEGGYIVPPAKYVSALRELCNRHGFLLITDEIQTGMGRTGKMFACDHFDITPDIMTLGKAVGGGYPMAVVAASHALMQKWPPGAHGTTFGGHPLPAAAGKAQLSIISDPDFLKAVQRKGESVRQRLSALKPRFAHVGDVRGLGLMNAVEFVKTGGAPDPVRAQQVVARLFQEKILVLTCGVKGNIIRLIPPLNIEDSLLDRVMDCIEAALKTG
jgi:4-aminobutyrate aminotransferase